MTTGTGSSKHAAIAEQLRAMVLQLAVDERLPPERELAERWGVARMTVRQAIAGLAREGLVRTVHGRGNLRAHQPLSLRVRLGSFADALREQNLEPSTRVLETVADLEPPAAVAEFMGPPRQGQGLLRIRRLRLGDGIPLALERTWLAADLLADARAEVLAGSLYRFLEERGLLPDSGEESVVAAMPDKEEAGLLAIPSTRPVLRLVRRAFAAGRPVEYAEAVFPADRYELWFPLRRNGGDPVP